MGCNSSIPTKSLGIPDNKRQVLDTDKSREQDDKNKNVQQDSPTPAATQNNETSHDGSPSFSNSVNVEFTSEGSVHASDKSVEKPDRITNKCSKKDEATFSGQDKEIRSDTVEQTIEQKNESKQQVTEIAEQNRKEGKAIVKYLIYW